MPLSTPPRATTDVRLLHRGDTLALWDRPGDALPLFLIHGNSTSREVFRPLFESATLAQHRMIALDLPGCGDSDDAHAPKDTYTLPGLGEVVVDVVNRLGLKRYLLVGWSLGGHIAIETLLHGATPDGIVLTGTPPCGPDPAEIAATFLPGTGGEVMSMEHPTEEQLAAFITTVYAPSAPDEVLRRMAKRADGKLRHRFFEHVFEHPELEPQRKTIRDWPGPFALIQGRQEPFFRAADLDRLAWGKLWRGKTQWIEDAGHAPFFNQPEAYARLLQAFAGDLPR
jgi:pimeloyl-ACP methyl ester carboxylesterase